VIPDILGQGRDPEGKVSTLSIGEMTLQANLEVEGMYATERMRKIGQLSGYLSALRRLAATLQASGQGAASICLKLHYYSPSPPSDATRRHFEEQIREHGVPGLVVVWHTMA
jgi:hypothetical protein